MRIISDALATNQRDVVGSDDAYAAIADEANVERNSVKGFFTVAMNCPSFEKAHQCLEKRLQSSL